MAKSNIGSSFTEFLVEEGIKDDVDLLTVKKVLADEFEQLMAEQGVSPTTMAKRMNTSRNQVYRLLDERDTGVTLKTIFGAAVALKTNIVDVLGAVATRAGSEPKIAIKVKEPKATRAVKMSPKMPTKRKAQREHHAQKVS